MRRRPGPERPAMTVPDTPSRRAPSSREHGSARCGWTRKTPRPRGCPHASRSPRRWRRADRRCSRACSRITSRAGSGTGRSRSLVPGPRCSTTWQRGRDLPGERIIRLEGDRVSAKDIELYRRHLAGGSKASCKASCRSAIRSRTWRSSSSTSPRMRSARAGRARSRSGGWRSSFRPKAVRSGAFLSPASTREGCPTVMLFNAPPGPRFRPRR
jgi:hypothetical protein